MSFLKIMKNEFIYYYANRFVFIGIFIGILINLMAYFYTSKAFSPNLSVSNSFLEKGYFEFIILGELCLLIPQIAMVESQEIYFRYKEKGLLEKFYFSKLGIVKGMLGLYFSQVLNKIIYIIISLCLVLIFFGVKLSILNLLMFLIVLVFSTIYFIPIYFLSLLVSFLRNRRSNTISFVINFLSLFSGAYFPLEILDNSHFFSFLKYSPITIFINFSRNLIYRQSSIELDNGIILVFWPLAFFIVSYLLYKAFFKKKLVNIL
jgi:ABC-type polysaccharide/polyol phosphate export permease